MNFGLFPLVAFWGGLGTLAYTFAGYGLVVRLLARYRPSPSMRGSDGAPEMPRVMAVVVAHNEATCIDARIKNLLGSVYPRDRIRVLVVSDGSSDDTVVRAQSLADSRVSVLARPERRGKASGLNAALAGCDADVVVFADARQRFAADTIARLAAHFADPAVGAVSGALEIHRSTSPVGGAVETYWRQEKEIRTAEAKWDSCIGCTGAVYAIRPALFTPIPEDTLLDDVVIPMQISVGGHRVVHDPAALAFDPQPLEPATERVRKRRTLAGNFQMLFRHPAWLLPWRNRLWWQLISHKYLRILAPALLALVWLANLALLASPFYRATFSAQCACYLLAVLGLALPGLRHRIFTLPAGFVLLNTSTVEGLFLYLRGGAGLQRWDRPTATDAPAATPPVPRPGAD